MREHDPIAELRPAYLAKRREDSVRMRAALDCADFRTIQTLAHNCKGTGAGYGFPEIGRAGAALEAAAKAGNPQALADSLAAFDSCVQAIACPPG